MPGFKHRRHALAFAGLWVALLASVGVHGATKPIELDGNPANGAESQCDLNVLTPFPIQIENKVTNRSDGDAFDFVWSSAGPGGFTSSVTAGTPGGVGAKWTWTTVQTVYSYSGSSCASDVCFTRTDGPNPSGSVCSTACLADTTSLTAARGTAPGTVLLSWTGGQPGFSVYRSASKIDVVAPANVVGTTTASSFTDVPPLNSVVFYVVRGTDCSVRKGCATNADCLAPGDGVCAGRGPFGVPGRSLVPSEVTLSAGSLTASLITFFSPPQEVFRATSTAGAGGVAETLTNSSTAPVTVTIPAYPPGCCPPDPVGAQQLRCGEACIHHLDDPGNCGSCGNACGEDTCCSNGVCTSLCGEARSWCNGQCADLRNDNDNCGACGNVCGDGTCCNEGACVSVCDAGRTWCDGQCVDLQNDSNDCGVCGAACSDGTCCDGGVCASVCDAGLTRCDGECADLENDADNCGACGNACGADTCCYGGVCAAVCVDGRTLCDGLCYDTLNDPSNCGACGNTCAQDSICTAGACVRCSGQAGARNACDNRCVNLNTDPYNCGSCGLSCNVDCPSGFKGVCSNGQSCHCVAGTPAPQPPSNIPQPTPPVCPNPNPSPGPVPGVCSNPHPSVPVAGSCPNPSPSSPVPGVCPDPGPPDPSLHGSPTCTVGESTRTIPPGGSSTVCSQGGVLFKEVATAITVCGDGIPGVDGACNDSLSKVTTGTFNRLVADPTTLPGDAYVTPYAVRITSDASNDGLLEPGESGSLVIALLNAGAVDITQASAILTAPAVDLSDDGVANPVAITVDGASVSYGTIPGTPVATNCTAPSPRPATNVTALPITVPSSHPGDTSHPINLAVSGMVNGSPFSMDVPMVLGIADKCDPAADTRDYNGVDGLSAPMAALVPAGNSVPFPSNAFSAGNTRPLKLRVLCGGVGLTSVAVDAPEIVGLSEATRGALDIRALNLNSDSPANPNDPFFRFSTGSGGGRWAYNMRTSLLGTGSFTLTIRIAGRKDYVTGFALR